MGKVGQPFIRFWRWACRLDWRVWGIVAAAAVSITATAIVYYLGYWQDPGTHTGAIFASWVGGLALFLVAGSVVAVVSLVRPENESFDARARILFRRQPGKHIDYIVTKIKEVLEHYAELTVVRIAVTHYDASEKKYRITSNSDVLVRSYLDDVETTYSSAFKLDNVTSPPSGGQSNCLVYARVAGTPVWVSVDFTNFIEKPVSCRIDRDGTCEVSTKTEFWVGADEEPNTYRPRRYTQMLRLHFENLLPFDQPVEVKLTLDGTNWITERLLHGASRQLVEIKDVKPGVMAFDYRILAP